MSEEKGELLPFPVEPELLDAIEALLFAAGEPVSVREICAALIEPGPDQVRRALGVLQDRASDTGVVLVEVAGRWQLRTHPRFADAILRLRGGRPQRLSKAALEVLSVVAYQQPVTRGEIDQLRGVDSGGVMRTLLDRGLVRVAGRADVPGRPLQYGTTSAFLELFGLKSLKEMPTLAEREEP